MTYFLLQTALISAIAVTLGAAMGWWLHAYLNKDKEAAAENDLALVKGYLAESIKESARLKIQLKHSNETLNSRKEEKIAGTEGIDFEAYQAFEETVKQANLRKYLN